jgi:hypothetical protein
MRQSLIILKNIAFPANYNNDPNNRDTFLSGTSVAVVSIY